MFILSPKKATSLELPRGLVPPNVNNMIRLKLVCYTSQNRLLLLNTIAFFLYKGAHQFLHLLYGKTFEVKSREYGKIVKSFSKVRCKVKNQFK